MSINIIPKMSAPCVFDVLFKAVSYIAYKKNIDIYVIPVEKYEMIHNKKNINIWNWEPILPDHKGYKNRRNKMEQAIKDDNVSNIFCFDLAQTKVYNVDKVKYFPLGYIDQMVSENNNEKSGMCFLGNITNRRSRKFGSKDIHMIDIKSYKSLEDTTSRISRHMYGIDTARSEPYLNFYVNCLRVSQYIMARTIVVSDNTLINDFGVKSYIYVTDMANIKFTKDIGNMAELALCELKKNVNMQNIFLGYDL